MHSKIISNFRIRYTKTTQIVQIIGAILQQVQLIARHEIIPLDAEELVAEVGFKHGRLLYLSTMMLNIRQNQFSNI